MRKRAWFELALGAAGAIYVILVFSQNISSPIFAAVVVMLAGYQLIGSHRAGKKP